MTCSTRPTIPKDFSIEVAENEGMPSRSVSKGFSPSFALNGGVTETLTLGLSKTPAAANEPRSAEEMPSIQHKDPTTRPIARLIARITVAAGLIASVAFPVFAQDGTGPIPQNAQSRSYGEGWNCDLGYRMDGAECLALDIPEDAFATGRSYGLGWECRRGYAAVKGVSCAAIPVPENAFLRSSGYSWQCDRGYRKDRENCVLIDLPDKAYLTDNGSGSGWSCERGFTASSGACVAIAVPENGYLTNADYGEEWTCERGFFKIDSRCDPVALPANAFLVSESYGPAWRCERGFKKSENACFPIDLPANAHLDRSGNTWRCNPGFWSSDGACVLGR